MMRHRILSRLSTRSYSQSHDAPPPPRSRHAQWYAEMVPGMIPVAILGSAVYLGLRLLQSDLAHEKDLEDAQAHIHELEHKVDALQAARRTIASTGSASPPEHGTTVDRADDGMQSRGDDAPGRPNSRGWTAWFSSSR
ncbi:hypothetical protein SERLA73DRAFT_177381 [Serpula lacrymans var. lacrymans S7.3]|uniref:Uncharacterized protein n=2 Tax=Serpula lacrymans var. lacrymans TaxID=341189 RepID=F8PNW9_SERL3|nr:uncharacterized protein SERLADRAFT_446705 [Serpula lacrymans var. lacrymans S7.9]EGO01846.1 hypothetical protein SERLA73DRAFT_177381 [Serpula lacrymans var. lacrymans S7.3]EGO27473.1 hypothetical protein SERLADRAFT_446705 [Serpula lacrymans var. lacrymans S7.9]